MKDRIFVILVGVPGSGKSLTTQELAHYAKVNFGLESYTINMDRIRAQYCGDAADQSKNDQVFDLAIEKLAKWAKTPNPNRKLMFWDNMSLTVHQRKGVLDCIDESNTIICAVHMNRLYAFCKDHNRDLGRVPVPDSVLFSANRRIQQPVSDEGFHVIYHVDGNKYINAERFFQSVMRFRPEIPEG